MRTLLPLLLSLLLAAPAVGQPADSARAVHAEAVQSLFRLDDERDAIARRHEELAAEIGALKSSAGRPLLPDVSSARLDALLKQAQSVAEQLERLDRAVAAAREEVAASRAALLRSVDAELATRRAALADAPVAERAARFAELKTLVEERGRLAAEASARPTAERVELPAVAEADAASPDELRELADEAQDHAEKVRTHMLAIETHLTELRERQRVLRAAMAFRRDEALFAEGERNRRVLRTEHGVAEAERVSGRSGDQATAGGNAGGQAEPSGGGVQVVDEGADRSPPPNAEAEAPSDDFGEAGGRDSDADGAESAGGGGLDADPGMAPDPVPEPVDPVAPVAPEMPVGAADLGSTVVLDGAFDPALLEDDEALGPRAIEARIRALEAKRRALQGTATGLEARGRALEEKARELDE